MGIQPALTQLRRISVLAAGMYSNPCIRVLDGRVGARVGGNGSSLNPWSSHALQMASLSASIVVFIRI